MHPLGAVRLASFDNLCPSLLRLAERIGRVAHAADQSLAILGLDLFERISDPLREFVLLASESLPQGSRQLGAGIHLSGRRSLFLHGCCKGRHLLGTMVESSANQVQTGMA